MITPAVWKAPFQVNTTITGAQTSGQVAALSDGSYDTAWIDSSTGTARLIGRHISAAGVPLTAEVTMESAGSDSFPGLVVTPDNKPHIVFTQGTDTYLGNCDTSLGPTGYTTIDTSGATSTHPAITAFADGSLFVTYTLQNSGSDYDILGQRIDATGTTVGSAITIFDDAGQSDFSRLATLDNGNSVAVFKSGASNARGFSDSGDIDFQIRTQDGAVVRDTTLAYGGTGVIGVNANPDVAALHSGGFVLAWT